MKHMEKHMVYRIRVKPESTAELICQLTLLPPVVSNKSLAKFIVVAYYHIPSGIHSKRQFHISMKQYTEYSNAWSEESSGVPFANRHSFFVFGQGSNVGLHISHRTLDIIASMKHCYGKLLLSCQFLKEVKIDYTETLWISGFRKDHRTTTEVLVEKKLPSFQALGCHSRKHLSSLCLLPPFLFLFLCKVDAQVGISQASFCSK